MYLLIATCVDLPDVNVTMMSDQCQNVVVNWEPIAGICSGSMYAVALRIFNDTIVTSQETINTSVSLTYSDILSYNGDFTVTVSARNGNVTGNSMRLAVDKPSDESELNTNVIICKFL